MQGLIRLWQNSHDVCNMKGKFATFEFFALGPRLAKYLINGPLLVRFPTLPHINTLLKSKIHWFGQIRLTAGRV